MGDGATDDDGDVIVPVDDTSLEGDMSYESSDALTVNLSVQPSGSGSGSRGSGEGLYSNPTGVAIQPGVGDTEPLTTGGLTCDQSGDPSTYLIGAPAAVVESCEGQITPLSSTVPLPGGGSEYIYYQDGSEVDEEAPPAGFDTSNATAAQLTEYGIRPRRPAAPPTTLCGGR